MGFRNQRTPHNAETKETLEEGARRVQGETVHFISQLEHMMSVLSGELHTVVIKEQYKSKERAESNYQPQIECKIVQEVNH